MLPGRFIWLDQLPLTNGKIDRKALEDFERRLATSTNKYAAPRTELERQLVGIWQMVLSLDRVGVLDNFFELGGHSLSAARVAVEIDKLLNYKLPISTLLRLPTIEAIARYLTQGDSAPAFSSLVALQPTGSKPPLFIVHGWGGDVHFYRDLAKLLPNQPVYGLQAAGLDGKVPRHINIKQMAAHYTEELRVFQREGPYHLVGYSLGGLIAFEVGRQLYQDGQDVAFLGLLDPPIRPAPWLPYTRTLLPLMRRSAHFHLRQWLRSYGRESIHLKRRWKRLRRWIDRNQPKSPVVVVTPECTTTAPQIQGFRDYYSAVASAYRLRCYPGAIDVIVSDSLPVTLLPLWGQLAKGGARLHRIACTHRQMIERDRLPKLASILAAAIECSSSESRGARKGKPAGIFDWSFSPSA